MFNQFWILGRDLASNPGRLQRSENCPCQKIWHVSLQHSTIYLKDSSGEGLGEGTGSSLTAGTKKIPAKKYYHHCKQSFHHYLATIWLICLCCICRKYTVIFQDVDSCRLLSVCPGPKDFHFPLEFKHWRNSYLPITLLSWPKLKHWSRAAITMLWLSYAAICSYDWVTSWAMHWSCICDHRSFAWIQGRSAWANPGHHTRSYKDISWQLDAIWYKYIPIHNMEWVRITRKRWSQLEFCQVCQGNQCTET